jgi:hypothetical protein
VQKSGIVGDGVYFDMLRKRIGRLQSTTRINRPILTLDKIVRTHHFFCFQYCIIEPVALMIIFAPYVLLNDSKWHADRAAHRWFRAFIPQRLMLPCIRMGY